MNLRFLGIDTRSSRMVCSDPPLACYVAYRVTAVRVLTYCEPFDPGTSMALRTTIGSCLVTQYIPRATSPARTDTTQQSNCPAGTRTLSSPITVTRVGSVEIPVSDTLIVVVESSHEGASGSARSAISSIAAFTSVPAGTALKTDRRPAGAVVPPNALSLRNSSPSRALPIVELQCNGRRLPRSANNVSRLGIDSSVFVSTSNQALIPLYAVSVADTVRVPSGVAVVSCSSAA